MSSAGWNGRGPSPFRRAAAKVSGSIPSCRTMPPASRINHSSWMALSFAAQSGDRPNGKAAPGRRTEGAVAGMGAARHQPVRRQKARVLVARPDHVLAQKLAVGKLGQRRQGAVDHRLVTDHQPRGEAHRQIGGVVAVQRGEAAIFPDLPGDLQDVVRQVDEPRVEALHSCAPVASRICFQIAVSSIRTYSRRMAGSPPAPNGPYSAWHMPMT